MLPPTTAPRSVSIPKHAQAVMQRGQSGLMMRTLGRDAEAAIDIVKAREVEPGIGP
jgi:hypothetical protein